MSEAPRQKPTAMLIVMGFAFVLLGAFYGAFLGLAELLSWLRG